MKHTPDMRRKARMPILMVLCLALFFPKQRAFAAGTAAFEAHYTTASVSAQEQSAGNLLNSDRMRYGLPPLEHSEALSRAARLKSEDMRDNRYFAHTSPTYGDVRSMLTTLGISYKAAGENIAHHASVEKAQAAFLSSPGHRRAVLSKAYTHYGVGIALDENGFVYLTQIFAR